MIKILIWDNTVGIYIAITHLQGPGSVILTYFTGPWTSLESFWYFSTPVSEITYNRGALGLSALFLSVRGSANQAF